MCRHQYLAIQQKTKPIINKTSAVGMSIAQNNRIHDLYGVQAGCGLCGQIITLWETGEIEIHHELSQST